MVVIERVAFLIRPLYSSNVTDFIYRTVQVLKENLYWIRISAQDAELMEPVEL